MDSFFPLISSVLFGLLPESEEVIQSDIPEEQLNGGDHRGTFCIIA